MLWRIVVHVAQSVGPLFVIAVSGMVLGLAAGSVLAGGVVVLFRLCASSSTLPGVQ